MLEPQQEFMLAQPPQTVPNQRRARRLDLISYLLANGQLNDKAHVGPSMPAAASRTSSEISESRVASGIRSIVVSFNNNAPSTTRLSKRRAHVLDLFDHAI